MKKIISLLITASIILGIFCIPVFGTEADTEDILCSAFVFMTEKKESLAKNYTTELTVSPVLENEKIFISVYDLEKFGATVNCSDKYASVIYGAFTLEFEFEKEYYYINEEITLNTPFVKKINGNIMADVQAFAAATSISYARHNNMGILYSGIEITSDSYQAIYEKVSQLTVSPVMAEIYVDGSVSSSGNGKKENPFKTINEAKEYAKSLISVGMTGDIYVNISEGIYTESLDFTTTDSGDFRVIYRGYNGMPKITTGTPVTNWEQYQGNIYRAYIGEDRNINYLTENGSMGTIARYPNTDYLYAVSGEETSTKRLFYYSDELPEIANISKAEVYLWGGGGKAWHSDIISVDSLDTVNKKFVLKSDATYAMSEGSRFYLQGAIELLDSEGEFFYDGEYLYYYPLSLPVENQEILIPNGNSLVEFSGNSKEQPVKNITFSNIEFSTTERDVSGIVVENARNIEISDCKINNIGKTAVEMKGYAAANRIRNCEIKNIGKEAVLMVNTSDGSRTLTMNGRHNEIINCHISDISLIYGDASGIEIDTGYNLVKNTTVHGGNRLGIRIGIERPGILIGNTVDGVKLTRENVRLATHSQNNHIMFCDVYDVMRDSQDGGAIYSWGGDYGNVIAYSHIHDTCSPFSYAFGIYLDDGADGFTIKNNIVDSLDYYKDGYIYASIFTKGVDNKVYNNITANNPASQYSYMTETMVAEPCDNLEYCGNIAYNSGYEAMYRHKAYHSSDNRMEKAENNVYYSADGKYGVLGITGVSDLYNWQEYYKGKFDQNALIGSDPMFADAETGDYRLKYNSPAYSLPVSDIEQGKAGLTKDYPFSDNMSTGKPYLSEDGGKIYGATAAIDINEELTLNSYIRSENGYMGNENISYFVSDESIAKVVDGKITGVSKGVTQLTLTYGDNSTVYDVFVGDNSITPVIKGSYETVQDKAVSLNISFVTEAGRILKYAPGLTYSVTDGNIASVSENGEITGLAAGTTSVTVSYSLGGETKTVSATVNVTEPLIFDEDFENGLGDWTVSNTGKIKLSDKYSHSGKNSIAIDNSIFGEVQAAYSGDKKLGNDIYTFWFYDTDPEDGKTMVDLTGVDSEGNTVKEKTMFGIKTGSYNYKYVAGATASTGIDRTQGWHYVVMDASVKGVITVYVDGKLTNVENYTKEQPSEITGIRFFHTWTGSNIINYIDSLKVYNSYEAVPIHSSEVIEDVKFTIGTDAQNAVGIVNDDGNVVFRFNEPMDIAVSEDFKAYAKDISSEKDGDYTETDIEVAYADENSAAVKIKNLEANKTYRIMFTGLVTADGRKVEEDFITFSTASDVKLERKEIFHEDFEGLLSNWAISNTEKIGQSDVIIHTGSKSLKIDNAVSGEIQAVYDGSVQAGNNAYAFWFYDTNPKNGKTMADLTGVSASGTAVKEKAMFGIKTGVYDYNYVGGNTASTGIERTQGWHYVVMDATTAGKLTVYIDGKETNVKNYTSGQPAQVTGFRFFHTWKYHDIINYIDGFKIYSSYADVPLYKTEVIESIVFDSGKSVDKATDVVGLDGNINITFKENISEISADNFKLYSRSSSSLSDADYVETAFGFENSEKTVISIEDFKASTDYRLVMTDIKTFDGTEMADDFVEFTASDVNVSAVEFYGESGNPLENISAGKNIKAVFEVVNASQNMCSAIPLITVYNRNKLVQVISGEQASLGAGESGSFEADLYMKDEYLGYTYKIMLWNSLSEMKPLCFEVKGSITQ